MLASHRKTRPEWLLALAVLAALATRLPFFGHPAVDFDEQLYSLVGAQLNQGALPYIDLWDRKPIGLFLIFAFAHALGGDGPLAYQILALLACLLGCWQVWRLGCRLADPSTAAMGAALYPLLLALLNSHSGQSEVFLTPFAMAMAQWLLAARDSDLPKARLLCCAAMISGGLALQIKYTVVVQCLFFGAAALWLLRGKGRAWPALAGDAAVFAFLGLLPTGLAALWFAQLGHLDDFVFANFTSISLRASMPMGPYWFGPLPFAIPLLALVVGGSLATRRTIVASDRKWALAWFGAAVVGLLTTSTIYYHNYAAAVPAAILCALPLFNHAKRWGIAAWLVFYLGLWGGSISVTQPQYARSERATLFQMATALSPYVNRQNQCLYVFDGPTALYQLSGSGLPSRIIYPDHLNNALELRALPVSQSGEVRRILAGRPGAVVTSVDPVTVQNAETGAIVARELALHYRKLGQWVFQDRRLDAFVRVPDRDGIEGTCDR